MIEASRKRPKRLWVAAIINILVALLSLVLLAFLFTSARVPEALRPGATTSVVAACMASFLIVASVMALLGKPSGRYLMLAAAIVFYGILIVQNAIAISGPQAGPGQIATTKLAANAVRASLELIINFWALLSLKTRQYFVGAAVAS